MQKKTKTLCCNNSLLNKEKGNKIQFILPFCFFSHFHLHLYALCKPKSNQKKKKNFHYAFKKQKTIFKKPLHTSVGVDSFSLLLPTHSIIQIKK